MNTLQVVKNMNDEEDLIIPSPSDISSLDVMQELKRDNILLKEDIRITNSCFGRAIQL